MERGRVIQVFILVSIVTLVYSFMEAAKESPFGKAVDKTVDSSARATEATGALACVMPNISIPDSVIEQFAGSAEKKICEPMWNEDGSGVDSMCLPYPAFCHKMPKIPSQVFAAFTEGFPCFALNSCILVKFNEAKRDSPSTVMKCWYDIAICFFNACYPGCHPNVMKEMAMNGKLAESAPAMAEGVAGLGKSFASDQAEAAGAPPPSMPDFG